MSKQERYKQERAWIRKKINKGVLQDELRTSVGIFSNRKKKSVMEQKKLSEKQYAKRKKFLGNCYVLLNNEKFDKKKEHKAFQSRTYPKGYWDHYDDIDEISWDRSDE
ncbi:MAG: hypothetical protein IJW64_00510 [Clostridia bacterium]|nr:hypothetical protein [Clostridia bacterium]